MIVTRAANKSILITRMQTDGHIKDIAERVLPKYFMRNKNGWDATTVASVFIFVRFANSILITGEMQNLWSRGEWVALFLAENNGDTITERVSKLLFFLLFKLLNKVISAATRATKTDNAFVMLCGIVVCTRLLALTFWTASHSSAIWPNDFSAVFSTSFGKRGRPKARCKIDLSNQQNKNESWAHPFPTILHTLDFRSVWPELNKGMLSDAHFGLAKGVYQKLRRGMTCQYWLLEILTTTKKRTHFSKETLKNVHFVLFHLNTRSPLTAAQLTNERVKCTIIFYENMDW